MKSRTVNVRRIGERAYRHALRIVDDPSERFSLESRTNLLNLLKELSDQPSLLMCGTEFSEKLTITHNGEAWILEAEAEVYVEDPQS